MKLVTLFLIALGIQLPAQSAVSARVELIWNRSPDDAGDIIYRIYRGPASGNYTEHFEAGSNTNYVFNDITPGVPYYFVATAFRDALESLPSDELVHTVPIGLPATLVANVTMRRDTNSVTVVWNANPADQLVFQYEVQFKPTNSVDYASVMTASLSTTVPTDATSTYNFRIRAISPSGPGPWLDRVVPALPGAPTSLLVNRNGSVQYIYKP